MGRESETHVKKILCALIANADPEYISTDPSTAYYRALRLNWEAEIVDELIWTLQQHYNSAVEPQASMYQRLERLYIKSKRRVRRRAIITTIELYRRSGSLPKEDHPHYAEVIGVLLADRQEMAV